MVILGGPKTKCKFNLATRSEHMWMMILSNNKHLSLQRWQGILNLTWRFEGCMGRGKPPPQNPQLDCSSKVTILNLSGQIVRSYWKIVLSHLTISSVRASSYESQVPVHLRSVSAFSTIESVEVEIYHFTWVSSPKQDMDVLHSNSFWRWSEGLLLRVGSSKNLNPTHNYSLEKICIIFFQYLTLMDK